MASRRRSSRRAWTLNTRLAVAFGGLVLLIAALGAAAVGSSLVLRRSAAALYAREMPALDALVQADRDLQQALVAERTILIAQPNSELFKKQVAAHAENLQQSTERWNRYRALARTDKEQELVAAYEKARVAWEQATARIFEARKQKTIRQRRAAAELSLGEAAAAFSEMREALNVAQELNLELAAANQAAAEQTYRRASAFVLGIAVVAALAGVFLWWWIGVRTSREVRAIAGGLRERAGQVVATAYCVSASAASLAQASNEQAATLEETASSAEQIGTMARETADHADRAQALMSAMSARVTDANQSIGHMVSTMASVRESSQRVSKIIRTIDEIAFQTNILALNAAVEAARAGEAGMGFAVVAAEVRNLAQRAAQAARDTTQLIEESMARSSEGDGSVQQVRTSIADITSATGELTQALQGIHAVARQQAHGLAQIAVAVQQMGQTTQTTAANAEESAAASDVLHAQANGAMQAVGALEAIAGTERQPEAARTVATVSRRAGRPARTPASSPVRRTGTHG
jgi:methyl-accepting chemotaxis protein